MGAGGPTRTTEARDEEGDELVEAVAGRRTRRARRFVDESDDRCIARTAASSAASSADAGRWSRRRPRRRSRHAVIAGMRRRNLRHIATHATVGVDGCSAVCSGWSVSPSIRSILTARRTAQCGRRYPRCRRVDCRVGGGETARVDALAERAEHGLLALEVEVERRSGHAGLEWRCPRRRSVGSRSARSAGTPRRGSPRGVARGRDRSGVEAVEDMLTVSSKNCQSVNPMRGPPASL